MCGIAGGLFWGRHASRDEARDVVRAMTFALTHRGPDGDGIWVRDELTAGGPIVALGHRRLAIIDLTDDAAQPMAAGPGVITYNGELYNFASLAAGLQADGERFRSKSDTEVLLRGYLRDGPGFLNRVRGMFAFGLWDQRHARLTLARDRFGIKPLYYFEGPDCFLFASEIRSLLASERVPRQLDRAALWQYLGYQAVSPPRTLVSGVRALPPGHRLDVRHGRAAQAVRYWDLMADRASSEGDAAPAARRVRELLSESVAAHLVSDVPVGVFLSGGIDSSAIALLMAEQGAHPVTFSVAMGDPAFDERQHARLVANACGADHEEIEISPEEISDALPEALGRMDHPSGDGINTFVISEVVRKRGLKVALSGLGADELFGGYPSFRRIPDAERWLDRWGHTPAPVRKAAARIVGSLDPIARAAAKTSAVLETDGSLARVWPVTRQLLTESERTKLLNHDTSTSDSAFDPYVQILEDAFTAAPESDLMARISYAEARTYMHDVLLSDTDQMSMAHGLEVRVPFVDHELASYVMGLPQAVKHRPGDTPKPLLVEAVGDLLPDSIVRRPKQGFTLPFPVWMRTTLRDFCEERLGPSGLGRRPEFRGRAVAALWQNWMNRPSDHRWSRLWTLVVLETWLSQHEIES